jgi:hypothetical protein
MRNEGSLVDSFAHNPLVNESSEQVFSTARHYTLNTILARNHPPSSPAWCSYATTGLVEWGYGHTFLSRMPAARSDHR